MKTKIRAVIIDDEIDSIALLGLLLKQTSYNVEILGNAQNVADGISLIQRVKPDLVFLDIKMPDGTGFELLERLEEKEFEVIFITAFNEYALKAFEFTAIHYLLKPADISDIEEALNRFTKYHSKISDKLDHYNEYVSDKTDKIALQTNEKLIIVKLNDILWLEADGPYTIFHLTTNERIIVSKSLHTYQEYLEKKDFSRSHSKYIVNLHYIKQFDKANNNEIELENGQTLKVSVRKKTEFITRLKKFTQNK